MTVISPRFAGATIALLATAALSIWLHTAIVPTYEDCANPEAFFGAPRIGEANMVAQARSPEEFQTAQGRLRGGSRYVVEVRVVRTFNPSKLYVVPRKFRFDTLPYVRPGETRWLEAGDDVLPVHWNSYEGPSSTSIEAYLFFHGGVPVWHPLESGLALALPQLVSGTRPVTLLIVGGAGARDKIPALRRDAESWLVSAWRQFEAACGS